MADGALRVTQLTYKQFLIWSMCQMTSLEYQLSPLSVQHHSSSSSNDNGLVILRQSLILRFVRTSTTTYYYYSIPNIDADELPELVNWHHSYDTTDEHAYA